MLGLELNRMRAILLILAVLSLVLAGWFFNSVWNDPACDRAAANFCEKDGDCVCGGKDLATGECFIGNIEYYGSCVDKTKDCPDFCSGITGEMRLKCEKNSCVQYMP